MEKMQNTAADKLTMPEFLRDALHGLRARPKYLASKYFYDQKGDSLFRDIMELPEYYLSRCELEILSGQSAEIAKTISRGGAFDLIELGPGDGRKSWYILQGLTQLGARFRYLPVDVSQSALDDLQAGLRGRAENVPVQAFQGDYMQGLKNLNLPIRGRCVILWLGANMGNMPRGTALDFCRELRRELQHGDGILMGVDLMKDPRVILNAYSDSQGITREFNLNLLHRMNRELGADFNLSQFEHFATYNPQTGTCSSYLVSTRAQNVDLQGHSIAFEKHEAISTEISQKYRWSDIEAMAHASGFSLRRGFSDRREYFTDVYWEV